MKKRKLVKLLALLLAGGMAFTACRGEDTQGSEGAKGRFVEQEIALPKQLLTVLDIGFEEDTISILGGTYGGGLSHQIEQWSSGDNGQNWTSNSGFTPLQGIEWVSAGARATDTMHVFSYLEDTVSADGEVTGFEYHLARLQNETLEELPFHIENPDTLLLLENGDILASYYYDDALRLFDGESGKQKYGLANETRLSRGMYAVAGDTLAMSSANGIELYELATGKPKAVLTMEASDTDGPVAIYPANDTGEDWYYANASGIYKLQSNGALSERLVDGDLNSLALPTMRVQQLFVEDGGFFILYSDENYLPRLYHYYYDETVPTTPETTLRIYSVEENPTMRLAANIYQQNNPAVRVHYEVGYTEGGSQTKDDVLKNLATQLVANNAPDIIMMDGLPMQSYIDRGALLDISDLLDESLLDGLFKNIALARNPDGELYAVTSRFTMPMLLAEPRDATVFETPASLASYLTAQSIPLFGRDTGHMMEALYPLYASRWLTGDYTLNTEALRNDLEQLKQIADLYDGYEVEDWEGFMFSGALATGVLFPVYLAELREVSEFAGPYTNTVNGQSFELFALPSNENATFIPRVSLAVSAASEKTEIAIDFIACVLGEKVQAYELGDGLPVNRTAMQTLFQYNGFVDYVDDNGNRFTHTQGVSFFNPFLNADEWDDAIMDIYWPSEEFFEQYALWETATTSMWLDYTVLEILESECTPYLLGQKSLDECMQMLSQRINLLSAENS